MNELCAALDAAERWVLAPWNSHICIYIYRVNSNPNPNIEG